MDKKITVSYLPRWDNKGYVYRCNIAISKDIFNLWRRVLDNAIALELDPTKKMWLSVKKNKSGNVYFLNLTQSNLFKNWIIILPGVKVNKKRLFFDANTCLIIKN
jgi:hypothetical protein